ncbi:DoxX family protein [Sporosarcina sp. D27]|uniref:DoxX family protein n=1 Tax=Sporosarcina sp. D27 TaxID=1382305 RepID=UPI00046EB833|nr:DoxX family protein [Sporosarcina sp. D27]
MEIILNVLQGVLIFLFLFAGFGKVTGSQMHIENFNTWGLPQWFRVVTGIIEVAGAALLIIGYWVPISVLIGALLLGITGVGGILTHIRMKDSFKETAMILLLTILSFIVFFMNL